MRLNHFSNISFKGNIPKMAGELIKASGNGDCLSQFIRIICCFVGLGTGLFIIGSKVIQNIIG